ncbi:hypothetical protein JAAARDRAFT_207487 [Jaapia argillacea MUCL 33604]|uniref:Uncharacterized protein n=1 Tax=Jaapia argillacea MUCL 33604 TaxID=933084 RepID=A0A067PQX3_9AGAM|nr:hypothetical protein JAAARDRAFT_207487 [Jaapia argillacea MUCL 33604]
MSDHADPETQDLLQSALSTAFSPAPLPRQSVELAPPPEPSAQAPESAPAPAPAPELPEAGSSAQDEWKESYEAQAAEWRAVNISQREKAEAERARWEEIRAKEKKEGKEVESEKWESVAGGESPSPADARDLVSGEGHGAHTQGFLETALPGPSTHTREQTDSSVPNPSLTASQKWEDLPSSLNSSQSYPSLSFPSNSNPETPPESHHHPTNPRHRRPHQEAPPHPQREPPVTSVTLSVFDDTLPRKTRVLALISALSINLFLPFINGVMLGFGEIFAKEVVVGWFGWNKGTNVGLGTKLREKFKPKSR